MAVTIRRRQPHGLFVSRRDRHGYHQTRFMRADLWPKRREARRFIARKQQARQLRRIAAESRRRNRPCR